MAWTIMIAGAFFYGMLFTFLPPAFIPPLAVPLLIFLALVIWALPTRDYIPRRAMTWLFMAFTAALVGWPNYLAITLPGLPWLTMTRLFVFPLALVMLTALSISPTFRNQIKQVVAANRVTIRLLLAFIFVMFVSIPFSSDPIDSFQAFVIDQIYWIVPFFVGCYLFRDPAVLVRWCWLLMGLGVFVSLIALWEWRAGSLPWAGHIPSFLQINDPSVARTIAGSSRAGALERRVEGTFAVSLGLGEYLALISPLLIHYSLQARSLWTRLLCAAIIPFVFFTIVNTGARVGSIGFVVGLVLYGAYWSILRWRTNRGSLLGPAIALSYPFLASVFLAATVIFGRLRAMVWGGANTQASNDARVDQFQTGWPKVFGAPLGHGVGQGAQVLGFVNGEGTLTIDTYTLRLALEYGILGLILFYAFFAIPIANGTRTSLRADQHRALLPALCVSLIVFLIIKTVYSSEFIHPIPFMMAASICAMIAGCEGSSIQSGQADRALAPRKVRSFA